MTDATIERPHRARRILLISVASVLGMVMLALGVVLTVGGIFVPANYLQPWSSTYYQQFTDPRMQVVSHALLAPSGHNLQPWIIELDEADDDALLLFADATRLAPAVDPLARQTMVTQGTFLAYLEVAAAELGYATTIELFPEGEYDESALEQSMSDTPVARVTIAPDSSATTDDYAALFLSDTNRAPYSDAPLTAEQQAGMLALAQGSGAVLSIEADEPSMTTLGDLANAGTVIETEYVAATEESNALFSGTEQAKNEARSGFAVEGQGTSGVMTYLVQGLLTIIPAVNDDATAARNAIAMTAAGVEHTAAYALISTPGNSRREQVDAGMLYAHLSLHARTLGLVMQPLSQVLQEYPTMAEQYDAVHEAYAPEGQTIQMLVRMGTATQEYPVSMRRDASALVRTP